jgi:hypothetical protein
MSEATEPSDEGTAEEYRRPTHVEQYGLAQHQPGLDELISISWTGSAREMIHEQAREAWSALEPRGCVLPRFENHESVVQIRTFPEAKALYGLITDELHRRQIDQRQRNSLHNARDQLEDGFEDRVERVREKAGHYWNGHKVRATGEFPSPSVAVDDVRLDAPVTDDDFVRARVKYHTSHRPSEDEVERVVSELSLMYDLDA